VTAGPGPGGEPLAAALRAGAAGVYCAEAGAELLIGQVFDGAQDSYGGDGEAALGMPMRV
jgi:hypothetical protein